MRFSILAAVLLLGSLAAHAQTADSGQEPAECDPVSNPPVLDKTTMTSPDYPRAAMAMYQEGTVAIKVMINPDGTVVDDSLAKSSGVARLDNVALAWVKQNWRWKPRKTCSNLVETVVSMVFSLSMPSDLPSFPPTYLYRNIPAPQGRTPPLPH